MELDTFKLKMDKLIKEIKLSTKLKKIVAIIWIGGCILLFLIHLFFFHFLPSPWFKGFEIGYSVIMCLLLFCNWLRRVELNWKYDEAYDKYCQVSDEFPLKE